MHDGTAEELDDQLVEYHKGIPTTDANDALSRRMDAISKLRVLGAIRIPHLLHRIVKAALLVVAKPSRRSSGAALWPRDRQSQAATSGLPYGVVKSCPNPRA